MVPRTKRLSRADFTSVAKGKRAVSAHFSLTYRITQESKVAVVVSKKIAKKATQRHLLKRRVLAVVRDILPPATSIIVYARKESVALPYSHIQKEMKELLTNLVSV